MSELEQKERNHLLDVAYKNVRMASFAIDCLKSLPKCLFKAQQWG